MNCIVCNKELKTNQVKYCSRKCAAIRNNKLFPKRTTTKTIVCAFCGKEFKKWTGNTKYCSSECHINNIHQNKILKFTSNLLTDYQCRSSSIIRKYLMDKQDGLCAICGISAWWNGKSLQFVMDHCDGNHKNNSNENLRLICHNCDSQLPTYKGRNIGKGRNYRKNSVE